MIALLYPPGLFGSQVLGRIGGHGISQGRHGNDTETFHPGGGRITGQHLGAEAVDHGLNQHHADGNGRLLKNRRQSHLTHGGKFLRTVPGGQLPGIGLQLPQENQEGSQGGNSLCKQGSPGCSCNAKAQGVYQIKIQQNIKHGGKDQQIQGNPGAAQGMKHGGQHIVHEQKGKSQKINMQIGYSHIQNVFRCT